MTSGANRRARSHHKILNELERLKSSGVKLFFASDIGKRCNLTSTATGMILREYIGENGLIKNPGYNGGYCFIESN
jgi:hypothetical protein